MATDAKMKSIMAEWRPHSHCLSCAVHLSRRVMKGWWDKLKGLSGYHFFFVKNSRSHTTTLFSYLAKNTIEIGPPQPLC